MSDRTPQSERMTTALLDTDTTTAARIEAARDTITAEELSEMFARALDVDAAPRRPYLPPRATQPSGWGREADRIIARTGR